MSGQNLNIVAHQLACKLTRDAPSEPVVALERVADADDENPWHMREVSISGEYAKCRAGTRRVLVLDRDAAGLDIPAIHHLRLADSRA